MPYQTRMGPPLRQVPATVVDNGVAAACPLCGVVNVAPFGEDGHLVWWPNKEIGTWCRHAQGAYAGGGVSTVLMFR